MKFVFTSSLENSLLLRPSILTLSVVEVLCLLPKKLTPPLKSKPNFIGFAFKAFSQSGVLAAKLSLPQQNFHLALFEDDLVKFDLDSY